jgi:nucleoside-diphosphate-sugar epimerase
LKLSQSDIASDQFPDALKGVDAVIHSAAPLPERAGLEGASFCGNVSLTRTNTQLFFVGCCGRVFECHSPGGEGRDQTYCRYQLNCHRPQSAIIVYGQRFAAFSFSLTRTDKRAMDWNPITKEQALTRRNMYQAAKTLAEQEVWAFGESHPELDITTCV